MRSAWTATETTIWWSDPLRGYVGRFGISEITETERNVEGDRRNEKQNKQIDLRFTGSGDRRTNGNRVQCLGSLGQLTAERGCSVRPKYTTGVGRR